jgi:hypothetical protein
MEGGFVRHSFGTPADPQTEFGLCCDDANLYLAFRAWQDTSKLYTITQNRGDPVWREDSVEFIVNPAETPDQAFYHIIVNPKGNLYDHVKSAPSFRTAARIQTGIAKDHYVVECAIPLKELAPFGITPAARFARFNVMRNVKVPDKQNPLLSTWCFSMGSNLDPQWRGWLCFVPQ